MPQPPPQSSDAAISVSPTEAECLAMRDAIDRALAAAEQAGKSGIAAAVLRNGRSVATGENEVHLGCDPTRHAEMVALGRAAAELGRTDLSDCVLVSTLQPCEMCLAAARFAGISRIVFAATQAKVPAKYFAFPHLRIEDYQNCDGFTFVAGLYEERVLFLYADGGE